MRISASIQKFVDGLDINSRYYLLLLVIQVLLIIATIYVKSEVTDNCLSSNQTEIQCITESVNAFIKSF